MHLHKTLSCEKIITVHFHFLFLSFVLLFSCISFLPVFQNNQAINFPSSPGLLVDPPPSQKFSFLTSSLSMAHCCLCHRADQCCALSNNVWILAFMQEGRQFLSACSFFNIHFYLIFLSAHMRFLNQSRFLIMLTAQSAVRTTLAH